jgi:protein gp37
MATNIEWTNETWNPVTGCTPISPGCAHCYAERMAKRLQAMGQPNYANGFNLTLHEDAIEKPLRWRKPRMIFVNSMSDLFHADVPVDFRMRVFDVMNRADWHTFQVLTKRSLILAVNSPAIKWTPNIWMGVSVESADYTFRIDQLRQTGAMYMPEVKFTSATKNVKVVYTHGIATGDWRFAVAVKAATMLVAADILEINGATKLSSADGVTSYSVENLSASYGPGGPYATKIDRLRSDAKAMLLNIGGGQFGM